MVSPNSSEILSEWKKPTGHVHREKVVTRFEVTQTKARYKNIKSGKLGRVNYPGKPVREATGVRITDRSSVRRGTRDFTLQE